MSIMRVRLDGGDLIAIFDLTSNQLSGLTSAYFASTTAYYTREYLIAGAIINLKYTHIDTNYNP